MAQIVRRTRLKIALIQVQVLPPPPLTTDKENEMTSEISPEFLANHLKDGDSYILSVTADDMSTTLQGGDYVRVFKDILYRLCDELTDECDGDIRKAIQIADDIHEEITHLYVSENSLPYDHFS